MKVPNWKASGRQQDKGRMRHRRRQQKAKAFKALVKKLQGPRQLLGSFHMKKTLPFLRFVEVERCLVRAETAMPDRHSVLIA